MTNIARLLYCAGFTLTAAMPASAWGVQVSDPDVFGITKVLAGHGDETESLVVQCDDKSLLKVAYLFRKKGSDDWPEVPARMLLKGASAEPVVVDAVLRTWNDKFAAIVAEGRTAETLALVHEIGGAKGKIGVGFEANGFQASASFSSSGSTRTMERVVSSCKLDGIAKAPA